MYVITVKAANVNSILIRMGDRVKKSCASAAGRLQLLDVMFRDHKDTEACLTDDVIDVACKQMQQRATTAVQRL